MRLQPLLFAAVSLGLVTATPSAWAQPFENPAYQQFPGPHLIERDMSSLDRVYRRNYQKFIPFETGDGKVLIVASDQVSDEQLIRAYNILDFYLTNVPGTRYGSDKSAVARHMGQTKAVLVMPDGADGRSKTKGWALAGQPLYQLEFPIEGSKAYMTNDFEQRDAGFEEIFHLVHDMGIGTRFSDGPLKKTYQAEITQAMTAALDKDLWGRGDRQTKGWIRELRREGSLEQEYIASVLDSFYGYWGAFTEAPGGMWGIYAAKTRAEVEQLDPAGAALVRAFLPDHLTYMARIDPSFQGTFSLSFDPSQPYTHKSQYLLNAQLLGDHPAALHGNAQDNILIGNQADNRIDGAQGQDVVQYPGPSRDYNWQADDKGFLVEGPYGTDHLENVEILRFTDRDIPL